MADWVIVVDDDTANLKMAGHILSRHGMRVTALKSGEILFEYLKDHDMPDVILLDILMPEMDGFEALTKIREYEKKMGYAETPVVFLTADEDRNMEKRGFEMGVADFVRKPFDPEVLAQRIIHVINDNRKIVTITEEAARDPLTGLLNKTATRDRIAPMCVNESGALCMIDLDSFKLVNDLYGHEMGDRVLLLFTEILMRNIGEESVCGRIGGDEFLLFGVGMRREGDIKAFAETINRELVEGAMELLGKDMRIPLGASVGAVSVPQYGTDYDELFNMADKALYTVKDRGKHGYVMYRSETVNPLADAITGGMDLKTVSKLLEERSIPQSVMWMGREAFSNVYRYMMRYLERYDVSAYKVLFTLHFKEELEPEDRERVVDSLRELIKVSLRNSDIMVQIGLEQFFLLLPELNPEHVDRVIGRMVNAWKKNENSKSADLGYEYSGAVSNEDKPASEDVDHVVVVDDTSTNLKMAELILTKEGMKVTCLNSGEALIDFIKYNDPSLILLDINMPGMDGFETMKKITARGGRMSRIPVIFLTADDDDSTETQGFALGAMDFIRKPFVPEILIVRVRHAIELIRLQNRLKSEVSEKVEENEQLTMHIIQALAAAIDAKDKYTSGHSGRVAEYSKEIAARCGYDVETQNRIYMMGLLHDVGKIGVRDFVINKPGRLSNDEYEEIKDHTVKGDQILNKIVEMPGLSIGARWHHERYDGSGYPDGLKTDDIPEASRIIAVADAYDAMSSTRSYRGALPQGKVREEIVSGRGSQFDPVFADIMLQMIDEDVDYKMREEEPPKEE